MKKLLAIVISMAMIVAMIPMGVFAAEPNAEGTADIPAETLLMVKGKALDGKQTISWTKVSEAKGYDVFFAKSGNDLKKVKTCKNSLSMTKKNLKNKAVYTYKVKAYKIVSGNKKYIASSPKIYIAGKTYKKSNAAAVKAAAKEATLTQGQTFSMGAKITKKSSKKPMLYKGYVSKIRYYSSAKDIATVDKAGNITANADGKAYVYAVAPSGVYVRTLVTVTKEDTPAASAYDVIFDMQGHGSAIDKQTVKTGETVSVPAAPVADGYVFKGWYKESTFTTPWNFDTDKVTANTTLYAKWEKASSPSAVHTHSYSIQSDGEWKCRCGNVLAGTDAPYITVLKNGQPAKIVPLDAASEVGKGSIALNNDTVTYTNSGDAQEVIIRTNGGNLVINAPNDAVHHYGNAKILDVKAVANNSYYEYGTIAFARLAAGHLIVKDNARINTLYATGAAGSVKVNKEAGGAIENAYATNDAISDKKHGGNVVLTKETNATVANAVNEATSDTLAGNSETGNDTLNTIIKKASLSGKGTAEAPYVISSADELSIFRDLVNSGKDADFSKAAFKLSADIDLGNKDWTPIGTATHQFSGVFDGNGHTISNLVINSDDSYNGLFGKVVGVTEGASYKTTASEVLDEENYTLKDGTYSEDLFKTVIKNFTIKNFNVITGEYGAAAIGWAENAYISRIKVLNGTVDDNHTQAGKIAGVVGVSGRNMIYNELETGADVTITGSKHSIAGIVSNIQRGNDGEDHLVIIKNCTNRATVNWTENGKNGGGYPIAGIVANAGSCDGLQSIIIKCTNEGDINAGDCNYACGIIGQAGDWVKAVYRCSNSGNITASAYVNGVAGICITEKIPAIACSNTGKLENKAEPSKCYDISSSISQLTIADEEFKNVAELNTRIAGAVGTGKTLILKNITVTDTTGTLTVPAPVEFVSSNKKICDSIELTDTLKTINLNGLNQTVSGTKALTFGGTGNTITVAENTTMSKVTLAGNNNTVVNNGTLQSAAIEYGAKGKYTIENNGSMECIYSVGCTANITINNNNGATIERKTAGHTIWNESASTIAINNHGAIKGYDSSSIALLLYDGCNVTINAYNGSSVVGAFGPYRGDNIITIKYQPLATINGQSWSTINAESYTGSTVTISAMSE